MRINFNEMAPATEEWMDEHGYFAGGPCYDVNWPAKHGGFEYGGDAYEMVVGHSDGEWFAEIEDADGSAVETWTNVHPDLAIMEALCFLVARTAYEEEGNCEDAVGRTVYETYEIMFGSNELCVHDRHEMFVRDICMGFARQAVKHFAGDDWREF